MNDIIKILMVDDEEQFRATTKKLPAAVKRPLINSKKIRMWLF